MLVYFSLQSNEAFSNVDKSQLNSSKSLLINQLKMNKAKILKPRNNKNELVFKGPLDEESVDIAADSPSVISLGVTREIFTVPQV